VDALNRACRPASTGGATALNTSSRTIRYSKCVKLVIFDNNGALLAKNAKKSLLMCLIERFKIVVKSV